MNYSMDTIVARTFERIMLTLVIVWVVLWLINPLGEQMNVFFLKTDNFLADFFNVMIYVSDSDIYHNTVNGTTQKIYLPLTYIFMSIFSGFENYSLMTLEDCYKSHPAMISCLFFTLISILIYFHAIYKIAIADFKIYFIILLSSVFLFTIERGNVILISAALSFYFLSFKDSDCKKERWFALLSLCLATVTKGYPAIFGLYLLAGKRYKDIIICIVLTLILTFIPFLWFDNGFANIPQFIDNVKNHNDEYITAFFPRYGLIVLNTFLKIYFQIPEVIYKIGYVLSKYSMFVLAIISVFLFFKEKSTWKQLAMVSFIIAYIPANNGFYCGLYFIPSILIFLKNNEGRKIDCLYMILFCVFLNPVQIVIHDLPISWMLSNLSILFVWILIIAESFTTKLKVIIPMCKK